MGRKLCSVMVLLLVWVFSIGTVFAGEMEGSIATTTATDICAFINGKAVESYHVNGKLMIPRDRLEEYGFSVIPAEVEGHVQHQVAFLEEKAERNSLNLEEANAYLQYYAAEGDAVMRSDNTVLAMGKEFPCYQVDGRDIVAMDMLKQFGALVYQEEQRFAYAAVGTGEEDIIFIKKAESILEDKPYQKQQEYAFMTETAGTIEEVVDAAEAFIKENIDPYFDRENYQIAIPNENLVVLTYCLGGFETDYIFHIRLQDGQAVSLMEGNERPARVPVHASIQKRIYNCWILTEGAWVKLQSKR